MLNERKTEWGAIWSITDGLKCGVTVKDLSPGVPELLSQLKNEVVSYQHLVEAYNAAKDESAKVKIATELQTAFNAVQPQQAALNAAIQTQMGANTKAPKGALQMPQSYPGNLYNDTLRDLSEKINAAVSAMAADLIGLSDPHDDKNRMYSMDDMPQEALEGVESKAEISNTGFSTVSWVEDT